jgi:peptide/nickel transport system permease protein
VQAAQARAIEHCAFFCTTQRPCWAAPFCWRFWRWPWLPLALSRRSAGHGGPALSLARPGLAVSARHRFHGRDVAAGIAHGARISLLVGISATLIGLSLGIGIGSISGYFGGWVDDVLQRVVVLFQTIPSFILLVVLVAIAQPAIGTIVMAIGLVTWPTVARLVRAEFRSLREKDFVLAARALGYSHARIILREIPSQCPAPDHRHLLGHGGLGHSAGIRAVLHGHGRPQCHQLGQHDRRGARAAAYRLVSTAAPGLAIVFAVLAFNLIGDGLNDALNPRFRRSAE